jgi:hypothetical protein
MAKWIKGGVSRTGSLVKSLPRRIHEGLKKKLSKGEANETLPRY